MIDFLKCPVCNHNLRYQDGSLKCDNNHSFDISKSGYVNLLNPGKKNNFKAGDSKEMIDARTVFFSSGSYQKIADQIVNIVLSVHPEIIVDAGCGDGYYTNYIAKNFPDSIILGFDVSKFGVEHASKTSKKNGLKNTTYCVANIFNLPLDPDSCDLIINVFAPVANEEFFKILKPDSYLLVVSAGKKHLDGLKRAIYSDVYDNEPFVHNYSGFEIVNQSNLKYEIVINGNSTIKCLFQMTPYYHRTSLEDKAKLETIDTLKTTIDIDFYLLKKTKGRD